MADLFHGFIMRHMFSPYQTELWSVRKYLCSFLENFVSREEYIFVRGKKHNR